MNPPFRIDPADENGIHLVDVDCGGIRFYIPYDRIEFVISILAEAGGKENDI